MRASAYGALLFASAWACAPLTYSDKGAVDFQTYASVRVSVTSPSLGSDPTPYLAEQLEAVSGFATVTVDPAAKVDAVLGVNLEVTYAPRVDDQGNSVDQYAATAHYTLTADAARVDSGTTTSTNSTEIDAAEGALDGVVEHYIAPYRL